MGAKHRTQDMVTKVAPGTWWAPRSDIQSALKIEAREPRQIESVNGGLVARITWTKESRPAGHQGGVAVTTLVGLYEPVDAPPIVAPPAPPDDTAPVGLRAIIREEVRAAILDLLGGKTGQ